MAALDLTPEQELWLADVELRIEDQIRSIMEDIPEEHYGMVIAHMGLCYLQGYEDRLTNPLDDITVSP